MFKRLGEENRQELIELIKMDEQNNLQFYEYLSYLQEDDDQYGFQGLYKQGNLVGAMYFSPLNMGLTVKDFSYLSSFKELLESRSSTYLYGRKDILEKIGEIQGRKPYLYRYGYLSSQGDKPRFNTDIVEQITLEDISSIQDFYGDKEIMIEIPDRLESIITNGSAFMVKEQGKVASVALAHSESNEAAIIGAVYTDPAIQGKGYGSKCLLKLVDHLHSSNKKPYLFYDASLAHLDKLYQRLSFVHTDDYWIVY